MVWYPKNVPKVSCCLCRAVHDRLKTRDKLLSFGMNVDPECVLCKEQAESRDRLFFKCPYSIFIWKSFRLKVKLSHGTSVGPLKEIS